MAEGAEDIRLSNPTLSFQEDGDPADSPSQSDSGVPQTKVMTPLVISFEIPGLKLRSQVVLQLRPSRQQQVYEIMADLMHALADQLQDDVIDWDPDGSLRKLEHLKAKATSEVDEWQARLKLVDEWKHKVNRAAELMNRMRDSYYRELVHLREQVYQKRKVEREGGEFEPDYALHFDPGDFTLDEQVTKSVNLKVAILNQELQAKVKEVEQKYADRILMLEEQIQVTKMILSRKEKQLSKVMAQLMQEGDQAPLPDSPKDGDGDELQASRVGSTVEFPPLPAVVNCDKQAVDKMAGKRLQTVGRFVSIANLEVREEPPETALWLEFLESKFGSPEQILAVMGETRNLDALLGYGDFQDLGNQLGMTNTDFKTLFFQLSHGEAFVPLRTLLAPNYQPPPSPVKPSLSLKFPKDAAPAPAREKSIGRPARSRRMKTQAGLSKEAAASETDILDPQSELQGLLLPAGMIDRSTFASVGTSDQGTVNLAEEGGSDEDWEPRASSKARRAKAQVALTPSPPATGKKPNRTGAKAKRKEQNVSTLISFDCSMEGAFSGPADALGAAKRKDKETTKDRGTDPIPFEVAFAKTKMVTRAVQSHIDAQLLDKALDFFHRTESGRVCFEQGDSDDESEEARDQYGPLRDLRKEMAKTLGIGCKDPSGRLGRRKKLRGRLKIFEPAKPSQKDENGEDQADGLSRSMSFAEFGLDAEIEALQLPDEPAFARSQTLARQDELDPSQAVLGLNELKELWESAPARLDAGSPEPLLSRTVRRGEVDQSLKLGESEPRAPSPEKGTVLLRRVMPSTELGIQCDMVRVELVPALERWFPTGTDPHFVQLKKVVEMAKEIEDRLPRLREVAAKLAARAQNGSKKEKELVEDLQRMGLGSHVQAPQQSVADRALVEGSKKAEGAVAELLMKHGVSVIVAETPQRKGRGTPCPLCKGLPDTSREGASSPRARTPSRRKAGMTIQRAVTEYLDYPDSPNEDSGLRRNVSITARPRAAVMDQARLITERAKKGSPTTRLITDGPMRSPSPARDTSQTRGFSPSPFDPGENYLDMVAAAKSAMQLAQQKIRAQQLEAQQLEAELSRQVQPTGVSNTDVAPVATSVPRDKPEELRTDDNLEPPASNQDPGSSGVDSSQVLLASVESESSGCETLQDLPVVQDSGEESDHAPHGSASPPRRPKRVLRLGLQHLHDETIFSNEDLDNDVDELDTLPEDSQMSFKYVKAQGDESPRQKWTKVSALSPAMQMMSFSKEEELHGRHRIQWVPSLNKVKGVKGHVMRKGKTFSAGQEHSNLRSPSPKGVETSQVTFGILSLSPPPAAIPPRTASVQGVLLPRVTPTPRGEPQDKASEFRGRSDALQLNSFDSFTGIERGPSPRVAMPERPGTSAGVFPSTPTTPRANHGLALSDRRGAPQKPKGSRLYS